MPSVNGRPPISWRADPKHHLQDLLLLSGMAWVPSCTPSCPESSEGSALGDISDITATANTPATPAMHPPIKLNIFPILSSLGMISLVIKGLPYNFKNRDRDRYGWSPTHMAFPPLLCLQMRTFRACPRRMMILSGGPRSGPWNLLAFIVSPFGLVETKRGTIGLPHGC